MINCGRGELARLDKNKEEEEVWEKTKKKQLFIPTLTASEQSVPCSNVSERDPSIRFESDNYSLSCVHFCTMLCPWRHEFIFDKIIECD